MINPHRNPPSQEQNTQHLDDDTQWIEDVKTTATTNLKDRNIHEAAYLCRHDYTPSIRKVSCNVDVNNHHLKIKRSEFQQKQRKDSK